jgi:hypothetical protein
LVGDCCDPALRVALCIRDLVVGRRLLVEQRCVDRQCNMLVNLVRQRYNLIST